MQYIETQKIIKDDTPLTLSADFIFRYAMLILPLTSALFFMQSFFYFHALFSVIEI